jgi:hypothetical protein
VLVISCLGDFDVGILCIRAIFEVLPWFWPGGGQGQPGHSSPALVAIDDGAEGQQADHDERFQNGADRHRGE